MHPSRQAGLMLRRSVHSNIWPDAVVVDETLFASVERLTGLKKGGAVVINSSKI